MRLVLALALAGGLASCGDGGSASDPATRSLTVMSWNVYIGADVQEALGVSDPEELARVASEIRVSIDATDFPDRAEAIADAVVAASPDLIALQEVALWRVQEPADPSTPATTVLFDFLQIALDALASRGVTYEPLAISTNVDAEVPTPDRDLRFTDRDVVLARASLLKESAGGGGDARFETNLSLESPLGGDFTVERGWAYADLEIGAAPLRFVSTHLEVAPFGGIQASQAQQLIEEGERFDGVVVLAGDFNSPADDPVTTTYELLLDSGLADAWREAGTGPGATCCHDPGLRDERSTLGDRIDLVLLSGDVAAVEARVVGDDPAARSPGGLWPSDHAGVVVVLELGS